MYRRRFDQSLAWLALLGLGFGIAAPAVDGSHGGRVDSEAAFGVSAHLLAHDVPHLGTGTEPVIDEHCALCHWGRSLGQAGLGRLAQIEARLGPSGRGPDAPRQITDVDLFSGGVRGPPTRTIS